VAGAKSALIVASYQFDDPKFAELRAPIDDVSALTRVLKDEAIGGFGVRALVNEPFADVRVEIEGFFKDRKRDDFLLLYFSSHGIKDPRGRLYFVCKNTKFDYLGATGISSDFVHEQIEHSRSRKILVFLDCCYSGAFTRGMQARASDTVDVTERLGGSGRVIITASSATEYAFEGGELTQEAGAEQPSVFTAAVVDGLQTGEADRDEDDWISVDELYDYVWDQVRERTSDQTPGKQGRVEGPLLIARSARPPRVAPLPRLLQEAMASNDVEERIGAIAWLAQLLEAEKPEVVRAGQQALERMIEDDSKLVSRRAKLLLDQYHGKPAPERTPESEPTPAEEPRVDQAPADTASAIARRGHRHLASQRYEKALAAFNQALELDPNHVDALGGRGRLYYVTDRYRKALIDLNRALRLGANNVDVLIWRGWVYHAQDKYEKALADFDKALELRPDDVHALGGRGTAYRDSERYEEALIDFRRALELDPDDVEALIGRGGVYYFMDRYRKALIDLNRALRLSANNVDALTWRGWVYQAQDTYEKALADFDKALELRPDDLHALAGRGAAYRDSEHYEEALIDFRRALELDPNDVDALVGRGRLYYLTDRNKSAITDLNRALRLNPDNISALLNRGYVRENVGQHETALADFDRVLELDPNDANARAGRRRCLRAL
jgi:tetratricopeptide (TPR) repeat protein